MKHITHTSEELKIRELTLLVLSYMVNKSRTIAGKLTSLDHEVQSGYLAAFITGFSLFSPCALVSREDKDVLVAPIFFISFRNLATVDS